MEYIKGITMFLVFIAFMDNVLVLGNMRKYIKLFCGIILIFIILQPVYSIFGEEFDIASVFSLSEIEDRMVELNENMDKQDNYINNIENNVADIVGDMGYELTYVLVTLSKEDISVIESINVTVKEKTNKISIEKISIDKQDKETEEEALNVAEKIADTYDMDASRVVVYIE